MDNQQTDKRGTIRNSLSSRVFKSTIQGAIVLGIVTLVIGLGLYSKSLVDRYVAVSYGFARSAASIIDKVVDVEELTAEAKQLYESCKGHEEDYSETDPEYLEREDAVTGSDDFSTLRRLLKEFRTSSELSDIYLGFFDAENNALVYICDPDENPDTSFKPGGWEVIEEKEINTFHNWNGEGALYDISRTKKYGFMCTSGMPIKDDNGKIICYVLADVTIDDVFHGMGSFVLQYTVALLVLVALIGYAVSRRMRKTLVEPINKIADTAKQYVEDHQNGSADTEHFSLLDIKTGDEIENLSHIMADMEHGLNDYEQNLTRMTAEQEKLSTELSLAANIQIHMLPSTFPAFPEHPEIDLYASMDPAKEVGGDFYDFYRIDEDHVGIVIADVSGKGIPAALFMMAVMILLSNNASMGKSPAVILKDTNEAICSHSVANMFVTVWLGILEISTGKIIAANAGHEYPVLRKPDGAYEIIKDKHGFVVGGMEGSKYTEYELIMEPGAKLFLYTDGVPEAADSEEKPFGMDRLVETLNKSPDSDPAETLGNMVKAVSDFVGEAEQFDDLTMVCLEYKGR